jgi:hypothetical protein
MKAKGKKQAGSKAIAGKDELSQQELIAGVSTFVLPDQPHPALETPGGKNNGAEPSVFKNQRKAQT